MTSGADNVDYFDENQLTKCRASYIAARGPRSWPRWPMR